MELKVGHIVTLKSEDELRKIVDNDDRLVYDRDYNHHGIVSWVVARNLPTRTPPIFKLYTYEGTSKTHCYVTEEMIATITPMVIEPLEKEEDSEVLNVLKQLLVGFTDSGTIPNETAYYPATLTYGKMREIKQMISDAEKD